MSKNKPFLGFEPKISPHEASTAIIADHLTKLLLYFITSHHNVHSIRVISQYYRSNV